MNRTTRSGHLLAGLASLLLPFGLEAATRTVTSSADSGPGSLREAITLSDAGDSILFAPSTNGVPILLTSGELLVDEDLTIVGNDTMNTVISAGMLSRIFRISDAMNVELRGITLTMGQADEGGALHITGSEVILRDVAIHHGMAMLRGGAIFATGGSLWITGSELAWNTASGAAATEGGGAIFNLDNMLTVDGMSALHHNMANGASGSGGGLFTASGTVMLDHVMIHHNAANRAGGGIEITLGDLTLQDVHLDHNDVAGMAGTPNPGNGGGLHGTGAATIIITGGTVNGNSADREGGGLWNATGTMTVDNVQVDENVAHGPAANDGGGGLFNNSGTLIVQNKTQVTNNVADGAAGSGGGIFNEIGGQLVVDHSTISWNTAVRAGGGIEDNAGAAGSVHLTDVILNNNSTGSAPGNGGGFHMTGAGNAMIARGTVNENTAALEGGGLWNGTGTMVVDSVLIDGNVAEGALADQGGGGIFNLAGMLTVQNGTVISNNMATGAAGSGGGIMNDTLATLTVINSIISANHAMRAGGGIEVFSKAGYLTTLTNVDFMGNSTGAAPGNGGAVHITGPGDTNINGGMAMGNTAAREGGGFWNGTGIMTLDNVMIDGNTASGPAADDGGGGLFNNGGTMVVRNNTMLMNNMADGAAGSGGGLFNLNGTVMIDDVLFQQNECVRAGGAIESLTGTITVSNSVFTGNDCSAAGELATFAPGNGGAVHVTGAGTFTLQNSTVTENMAGNEGGGLWGANAGVMNVSRSAVYSNEAPKGGGLFLQGGEGATGTLWVEHSTVANNMATTGGGVQVNGGVATIVASTIAGNMANEAGGGTYHMMGTLNLNSTIVADNAAAMAPDVSGALNEVSFTLVENAEGATGIMDGMSGNRTGVDPDLNALADNGGSTWTMELECGSVAIDMGDPDLMANDQRDLPVFGVQRDMGAAELQIDCATVGVGENGVNSDLLQLYPVPANAVLNIGMSTVRPTQVVVLDAVGRVVIQVSDARQITQESVRILDVSSLSNGTYLLNLLAADGSNIAGQRFTVAR